jgi:hypothetical protein
MVLVRGWRLVNSRYYGDSIAVIDPTVVVDGALAERSRSVFQSLNIRLFCRQARWPGTPLVPPLVPDERTRQLARTCPALAYALLHPGVRAIPAVAAEEGEVHERDRPDISLQIKRRLHRMVVQGLPLREVMADAGLPWAYRRLPPRESRRVLRLLPALTDRDILDFMPANASCARDWLNAIDAVVRVADKGHLPPASRGGLVDWFKRNAGDPEFRRARKGRSTALLAYSIADWLGAQSQPGYHGRRFNPAMSPRSVQAALDDWHSQTRKVAQREAQVRFPEESLYPIPALFDFDDGSYIERLESRAALCSEGYRQQNCVSSYYPHVLAGRYNIFSLRSARGESLVTIAVAYGGAGRYVVEQAAARCNLNPDQEAMNKIHHWLRSINGCTGSKNPR